MKGFLQILFFLCVLNVTHAQQWEWAQNHGGGSGKSVKIDVFGNICTLAHTAGYYYNNTNLPPLCIDVLAKYQSDTVLTWSRGLPFYSTQFGLDKTGNLYVSGRFEYPVTISGGNNPDQTVTPVNGHDAILCKYDPNGNLHWVFTWDNNLANDREYVKCSQTDAEGNTYLFGLSLHFESPYQDPEIDSFILKIDSTGSLIWSKTNNWADAVNYSSTDIDNSGVYFTGVIRYSGKVLGQQLTSNLFSTVFLGKMTETGNLVWAKTDGSNYDESYSIKTDNKGSFFLSGLTSGPSNFSGNILAGGMLFAKYDTSGVFQWARGATTAFAHETAIDQDGSLFVTGQMAGNPTPNSPAVTTFSSPGNSISLSTNKQCEIFVVKYDQNGNIKWGIAPTGPYWSGNSSYSIVHDQNKSCYITGAITGQQTYFGSTMLSNTMSSNIFMARLRDTIASVITNISKNERMMDLKLMPNPGAINTTLSLFSSAQIESYKIEIISADGKKIYERPGIVEQQHALDLASFVRGLYFVRVEAKTFNNEIHIQTLKLIVN